MGRNAQMRRFRRDLDKSLNHKGPAGTPHPSGNRALRRSKEGKQRIKLLLEQIRALSSLKEKNDYRNSVEAQES